MAKSLVPEDLSEEQLQELSRKDWRFIEAKGRKVLKGLLRSSSSKAINSRELVDIMRSAALAKDKAYPEEANSSLQIYVPAKLLKPIEQAILGVSKKHTRESISTKPEDSGSKDESERT